MAGLVSLVYPLCAFPAAHLSLYQASRQPKWATPCPYNARSARNPTLAHVRANPHSTEHLRNCYPLSRYPTMDRADPLSNARFTALAWIIGSRHSIALGLTKCPIEH